MSRKTSKRTVQIKFALNDSIALEALILNRLATLPATRRNGWLQSLLVRGFREECAEIRALEQGSGDASRYIPGDRATTKAADPLPIPAPPEKKPLESDTAARSSDQPLALSALKAVVG